MYAVITNTCVIYIFNVTTYVLTDALIIQYNSLYETNLISSNQHIFYTKEREREREKKRILLTRRQRSQDRFTFQAISFCIIHRISCISKMLNFTAVELLERPKSQRRSNDIKLRYHLRHTRLNFFTETELAREQERRNVFKNKRE